MLEDSGYRDALAAEASLEAEGRIENLLELVAQMREYEREAEEPTLAGFLERIALASDVDGYDPEKGAVSLMTVHTAKGLEFPWVFLTGLEENIFPHARSVDDDAAVEEERRLCYVAVTRAMRRLFLTRVRRRRLSGQELPGIPSRFLRDLPAECAGEHRAAAPGLHAASTPRGPAPGRAAGTATCTCDDRVGGRGRGGGAAGAPRAPAAAPPARPPAPTGQITVQYDEDAGGGGDEIDGSQLGLRIGGQAAPPPVRRGRGARLAVGRRRPEGHHAFPGGRA